MGNAPPEAITVLPMEELRLFLFLESFEDSAKLVVPCVTADADNGLDPSWEGADLIILLIVVPSGFFHSVNDL